MEKERKDEGEEFTSKAGMSRWHYYLSPISWPLLDSENIRNQEMHKTFASDGELNENMTATYWG